MSNIPCPICGKYVASGLLLVASEGLDQHRCSVRAIRGIDAAHKAKQRKARERTFGERLAEYESLYLSAR